METIDTIGRMAECKFFLCIERSYHIKVFLREFCGYGPMLSRITAVCFLFRFLLETHGNWKVNVDKMAIGLFREA